MSQKIEIDGKEVEVYTAEEVQQREVAARTKAEGEFKPQIDTVIKERDDARKALSERTGEIRQFRKLNDEQKAQLTEKERIIYENQEDLAKAREAEQAADKKAYDFAVLSAIRSRVGNDKKVVDEVLKMYDIIDIEDSTEEGIAQRVKAAVGALGTTQPDLLASVGLDMSGGFQPPAPADDGKKSFADTDSGKALASDLGLKISYTEEEKKALGIA